MKHILYYYINVCGLTGWHDKISCAY